MIFANASHLSSTHLVSIVEAYNPYGVRIGTEFCTGTKGEAPGLVIDVVHYEPKLQLFMRVRFSD